MDRAPHAGRLAPRRRGCDARVLRSDELDIDSMNKQFYEAMKDVPFRTVRAQAWAARNRMLRAWGSVDDDAPEADAWIRKARPEHYAEHLPRLREWVAERTR